MARYYIMRDGSRFYKDTVQAIVKVAQKLADDSGVSVPIHMETMGTRKRVGKAPVYKRNPRARYGYTVAGKRYATHADAERAEKREKAKGKKRIVTTTVKRNPIDEFTRRRGMKWFKVSPKGPRGWPIAFGWKGKIKADRVLYYPTKAGATLAGYNWLKDQ